MEALTTHAILHHSPKSSGSCRTSHKAVPVPPPLAAPSICFAETLIRDCLFHFWPLYLSKVLFIVLTAAMNLTTMALFVMISFLGFVSAQSIADLPACGVSNLLTFWYPLFSLIRCSNPVQLKLRDPRDVVFLTRPVTARVPPSSP